MKRGITLMRQNARALLGRTPRLSSEVQLAQYTCNVLLKFIDNTLITISHVPSYVAVLRNGSCKEIRSSCCGLLLFLLM